MSKERQRRYARVLAAAAGLVVLVCVTVLVVDYLAARARVPEEEQRILALQGRVREDASAAPELAAEHARITEARRARKARGNFLAIVLIAAGAGFISSSKWLVSLNGRRPVALSKLVQLQAPRPAVPAPAPLKARAGTQAGAGIDLEFVAEIVEKEGTSREAAVPILQAIQSHYGYLPDEALRRVCELTEITPAQIAGTSSFYARFRRSPVGRHIIRVCHGTACHVAGARQITDELRRQLGIAENEDTDPARMCTVDEVACLGCCSLAPVLMVDDHTAGRLTPSGARGVIELVRQQEPA